MNNINDNELKKITGGGLSLGTSLLIGGIITFIIGVIDGYVRPLKCRR
jgi:bacteriocin-like protein